MSRLVLEPEDIALLRDACCEEKHRLREAGCDRNPHGLKRIDRLADLQEFFADWLRSGRKAIAV